ncbi:hypothetical protein BEL04_04960 [Mucilaginibacter sp. PPCGB 2223]|uniref:hypothetical protein n=1 Tax=Mucilaginibacter sp. PPCGB 2223 TaxID=1886027 RepID=UPI000825C364|nr:hypothetical protein [Mucilaginibacter sp. PPCGB 2223]OCX53647.1 hypothetical protein BEL04_04960 [Mucilaginibacter sp. PPCGB 2223]
MNKTISYLFLLFTAILMFACEKQVELPVNSALVGKWAYTGNSCNCTAESPAPVPASGSNTVLYFTPKSYYNYVNHEVTQAGTYAVVTDTLSYNHQPVTRIIYDGNTNAPKIFYKIVNGTLTFYTETPVASGGTELYYVQQ